MNIAVGKISDEARAAIEVAGGRIEATLNSQISMVVLPGAVHINNGASEHSWISLPGDATLIFTRAWKTEDCSLNLCQ